ncbi:hypothetical protein FDI24_gp052 [Acidovorax phage ACP17]|uniref:Uncharacterized protein n=1 Tax=Acidovorax phage ACP17 TaxID=2010329 RepID=A0A223AIX8_9CAUD|nr:hypothetical protein FDI24_gp052 [Acidovorax phage ACP17]ASS33920.1 hypothetical protein [Acidovorax phage ACP17]
MTKDEILQIQKTLWASILENGTVLNYTGAEPPKPWVEAIWSYYRGDFNGDWAGRAYPNGLPEVDWTRTEIPYYQDFSEFVGTDESSSTVECMIGKLVFVDSSFIWLGTKDITGGMRVAKNDLERGHAYDSSQLVDKWFR